MSGIKTNIIYILIIALLIAILYITCNRQKSQDVSLTSHDTTTQVRYVYYKDTTKSKPTLVQRVRDTLFESYVEYYPAEGYTELLEQFQIIKQDLLSRNIYKDSLYLDSLGWVKITDTVQKNELVGRNVVKDIKIPIKELTIVKTIEAEKRRGLYLGGSIFYVKNPMTNISGGFMYKDKHDRLFGAQAQWDGKNINYGVSGYLKLSFRKNNQ